MSKRMIAAAIGIALPIFSATWLSAQTRAASAASYNAEAYVNRGLALLQQGKNPEAERDFSKAIELKPDLKAFIDTSAGHSEAQRH